MYTLSGTSISRRINESTQSFVQDIFIGRGGDSNVWYMYMCIHVVGQNRGQAPQETRPLRLLLTPHTQLAKTKFTVHHTLWYVLLLLGSCPLLCIDPWLWKQCSTVALGKTEEGAYMWDCDISDWRPLPTVECHVGMRSLLFSGCLMGKNDKVRDNMTQMINDALAVASVFISYWILIHFYSQRGGALYMRQTAYARTVEFLMYVSYCGLVF